MNNQDLIDEKEALQLIWNYFALHVNQRLTHIIFFTALSSAIIIAQFSVSEGYSQFIIINVILAVLQCLVSFVFYKIDDRTTFLIKHAEKTIIEIEKYYNFRNDANYINCLKLFTNEENATKQNQKQKKSFLSHLVTDNLIDFYSSLLRL